MKAQAKFTTNGRITLPAAIRKALGVKPGDSVVFEEQDGAIVVRPMRIDHPGERDRNAKKR